jgi:membrane associated rhomboid family serine protease
MFRSRGENLRSTYILLFLNIAFYLLQLQDEEKFMSMFAFDRRAVMAGQIWRLFTYQFAQATRIGSWVIWPGVTLFINLILLTLMGLSVESEWGTSHFVRLYLLSTLTTVLVAGYFNAPLAGTFFINFTLLFVYATLYRDQAVYLIFIPIRITFLALFSVAMLVFYVFVGSRAHLAVLVGAAVGYVYFLTQRVRMVAAVPSGAAEPAADPDELIIRVATRNMTRVAAMKKALTTASDTEIDRLIELSERETIAGVNICPPIDFKPEGLDRYCVRCDGFAECTARYLRLNRPRATEQEAS